MYLHVRAWGIHVSGAALVDAGMCVRGVLSPCMCLRVSSHSLRRILCTRTGSPAQLASRSEGVGGRAATQTPDGGHAQHPFVFVSSLQDIRGPRRLHACGGVWDAVARDGVRAA
jgi:hypothetical protein